MNAASVASRTATAAVAGVAGFASYRHIVTVATRAGEFDQVAAVLPLAIDGLIVVATLAMWDDKRSGRVPRLSARFALAFGVVATLAANVASAQPTWTARAVAAVPAISFLLAVEVLARRGRLIAAPAQEPVREPVAETRREPVPVVSEPVREPVHGSPEPVREPLSEPVREPGRRVRSRSLTAAERVIAAHGQDPHAPHQRIAERAGVSVATVKRHRPERLTIPGVTSDDSAHEPSAEPSREPLRELSAEPVREPLSGPVHGSSEPSAEPGRRVNGERVPALIGPEVTP